MDFMDIDQVFDIPDTPDRFAAQNANERVMNPHREKSKLVIGNGGIRTLTFRPPKSPIVSEKSEGHSISASAYGNSSSTRNAHLFRRPVGETAGKYQNKNYIQSEHKRKEKGLSTSQSSCEEDMAIAELMEQSGHGRLIEGSRSRRALDTSRAEEIDKGSLSTKGYAAVHTRSNSSKVPSNSLKGKEKIDDKCEVGSRIDNGKQINFIGESPKKSGNSMSAALNSMAFPRATGQKRLVRNGCISPHNIAKAKQCAEKLDDPSVDAVQNDIGSVACNVHDSVDIRDVIAEDNGFRGVKGKGVLIHPLSSNEPDTKTINLSGRSSINKCEKANQTGDLSRDAFGCFEGFGGWRSTRNRTKNLHIPSSDENASLSTRKDDTSLVMPQLGQFNEPRNVANALIKRQKHGLSLDSRVDCSTPGFDNSEIVVIDSSGGPSTSRSVRNENRRGKSHQVIEIDDFSPRTRPGVSQNIGFPSNDDSDARARQLEADEMLARELQEQLYSEVPVVGSGEIDALVAFSLQNEEDSNRALSGGTHSVSHPRGSLASNLYRQSLAQSSHNPSTRRGTQSRVTASTRTARLRGRPSSQSRRLPAARMFPSSMDIDTRMHILEALEAFSDMGVDGNLLQAQRDFNENDYEMLLALDENNHHIGTSVHRINGLPQSTVQCDNFEEACAICLETPTIGDTIRHLPCLHKFHKDCIDPWLGRSTSCPVCKSSIT